MNVIQNLLNLYITLKMYLVHFQYICSYNYFFYNKVKSVGIQIWKCMVLYILYLGKSTSTGVTPAVSAGLVEVETGGKGLCEDQATRERLQL